MSNLNGAPKAVGAKVAVIGAGSAGLVAAKELLEKNFHPVVFERRAEVGGIWQYDADPGECKIVFEASGRPHALHVSTDKDSEATYRPPPGPMYDGLRTNIPSDLMTYRDHPFSLDADATLFPNRAKVDAYLGAFADRHSLRDYVRFETLVRCVRREAHGAERGNGAGSLWRVTSENLKTGERTSETFSYIISASGRCNVPSLPPIPGLWNFRGQLLHSAWYRFPTTFRDKIVLVLGNASSGMDIARELCGKLAREFSGAEGWAQEAAQNPPGTGVKVYQSVEDANKPPGMDYDPKDPKSPDWARRIEVVPRVERIEAASSFSSTSSEGGSQGIVVLEGGRRLENVDCIVFGTGYLYDVPYIDQRYAPFDAHPLIASTSSKPTSPLAEDSGLHSWIVQHQGGKAYVPPYPAAPAVSNLDDWQIFYGEDKSLAFLGLPGRVVPFPLTHTQSRLIASYWAGETGELPRVRSDLPASDPEKWKQAVTAPPGASGNGEARAHEDDERPVPNKLMHDFGTPADTEYTDALIRLLPGQKSDRAWEDEYRARSDGRGNGPRGKEGWGLTPLWRRERRANGKELRREALGY